MNRTFNILLVVGCVISIGTAMMIAVRPAGTSPAPTPQPAQVTSPSSMSTTALPALENTGISRALLLTTNLSGASEKIVKYTVQGGDSPSSIAKKYGLKPESILWANDKLNASAGSLQPGMQLNIPPVNGVVHTAHTGDSLESIAAAHEVQAEDVLDFPGNNFDLTQPPVLKDEQQVIVPHGVSPILWSETQPLGAGQVESGDHYSGNVPKLGSGYFIWPVNTQYLTQDFWSGHLGIDIQTDFRQPVFAADSGTVTFAGWDTTGYGNFVVINHGNGYKTTYGHNEALLVSVGQTVVKGQQIAESGSTGNSTGNHLDFRIIDNGTFVNPLDYLPQRSHPKRIQMTIPLVHTTHPTNDVTAVTRRRYQRIAPFYDLMGARSEKRFRPWRIQLWSNVQAASILEVGVGTGRNMPYYPPHAHITAIDLTPGMLQRAQDRARQLHLDPRIDLQLGDVQALEFPAGSFDCAVATCVFCSVPDPVLGLREMKRVVKPGGLILLLEHMRAANPLAGSLMDLLNPLVVRLAGANINRRTLDNVRLAGLQFDRIEDLGMGGIIKLIVARAPSR